MRVISGKAGGRKLKSIKKSNARPTLDRVKEAMFSMLAPYIPNTAVLDLFAGFGGLGLEAMSRGADSAVLVEKNRKNVAVIKENINICNFAENTKLIKDDVFKFLNYIDEVYDLIIMDPPYEKGYAKKSIDIILKRKLVNNNALIVVEHSSNNYFSNYNKLNIIKEKEYGDTAITIFQYREEN